MSIMFNEICINEEMLPKYTYIYIYMVKYDPWYLQGVLENTPCRWMRQTTA